MRGFTLLELTIYIFLFLLLALCSMQLFTMGRGAQQTTISSFVVSGQADTALRWLRRDLQETALVSLRTYPSQGHENEPPGCSMTSARDSSSTDNSQLNVSQYGAPFWGKHVFYTLVVKPGGRTGDLVRWEHDLTASQKDFVPRPANGVTPAFLPSALGDSTTRRTLLHGVLAPETKVDNLGGAPNYKTDQFGGFRVQFVRKDDSVTSLNPGDAKQIQDSNLNTSVVELEVKLLTSDTSRPTMYALKLRMHPRY